MRGVARNTFEGFSWNRCRETRPYGREDGTGPKHDASLLYMNNFTLKCVVLVLLIPWVAACTAALPAVPTEQPTATGTAVSPTATPTLFRSEAYSLTVSLPPGWAAAEGPVRLADPFDGLVAFNSFGEAGFFAKEVVSPDGSRFSYGGSWVLEQIPPDGAYIVLVHQSGGPAPAPESPSPEYGRADLGGLWAAHDCRTGKEQAGASVYDFVKGSRRLRLEVYCGAKASDATVQAVNGLLESWRFGAATAASAATLVPAETLTPTLAWYDSEVVLRSIRAKTGSGITWRWGFIRVDEETCVGCGAGLQSALRAP